MFRRYFALATLLLVAACSQAPAPDEVQDTSSTPSIGTFQATPFGPDFFAFRVKLNLPQGTYAECYIAYGDLEESAPFECGPQTVTMLHQYIPPYPVNQPYTATLYAYVDLYKKPGNPANLPMTPNCKPSDKMSSCGIELQGRTTVRIGNPRPYIAQFYASVAIPPLQAQQVSFPLSTTFNWVIGDVHNDNLTCRLDVDGNGTWEYTIPNCDSQDSQSHTYNRAATYTPKLQVLDSRGASFTTSFRWGSQNNQAPQINAFAIDSFPCLASLEALCLQMPNALNGSLEETFYIDVWDDNDPWRVKCTLDPEGDGSFQVVLPCDNLYESFTYTKRGNYYPRLRVIDPNGFAVEANLLNPYPNSQPAPAGHLYQPNVLLPNMPPVIQAFIVSPTQGVAPLLIASRFTVYDPDGDPLMCTLAYGFVNDSNFYQDGGTDLLNCAGIGVVSSSRSASHTFVRDGSKEVRLTVNDFVALEDDLPSQAIPVQVNPAP